MEIQPLLGETERMNLEKKRDRGDQLAVAEELARRHGLDTRGYILEMARLEAETLSRGAKFRD